MACPSSFDQFQQRTEDFVEELYGIPSPPTFFDKLVPQLEYPHGVGLTRTTFTAGRSLPTLNTPDFDVVQMSDGESFTGACDTTFNLVQNGFYSRDYRPEKFGWKSDVICEADLRYSWQVGAFLPRYMEQLKHNAMWTIHYRLKAIYDHLVPKAVACPDGAETFEFDTGGSGFPAQTPNLTLADSQGELTLDMLDTTFLELEYEGAMNEPGDGGWINYGNDGNMYTLDIDAQLAKQLFKNNSERRVDYRVAWTGAREDSPLVKRLMASRQIGNFTLLSNPFPTRYTYGGGAYTEVDTWVADGSATKGSPVKLNPAWKTAGYVGTRVLSPHVFSSEIVKPVTSPGGNVNFPGHPYMGEFIFKVGANNIQATGGTLCEDPFETRGRHYARYEHAPRPVKVTHGRLIISKRCDTVFECVDCSSS